MKVGVIGDQGTLDINWDWVRARVREQLKQVEPPLIGVSSLAEGVEQIFAECCLAVGGGLVAVVPTLDYEKHFSATGFPVYRRLKRSAIVRELVPGENDDNPFYKAGKAVVDEADGLIAFWDGLPSKSFGGTSDVIKYALEKGRSVVHINPVSQEVAARRSA